MSSPARRSLVPVSFVIIAGIAIACGTGAPLPTAPPAPAPTLQGIWSFTLSAVDTTDTTHTPSTISNIAFIEHDGIIAGAGEDFRFEGVRQGDQVQLDVLAPDRTGTAYTKQTTMYLRLAGDSLDGSGAFFHPNIDVPRNPDGTINPKFTQGNGDSAFINATEIYRAQAHRTDTVTAQLAREIEGGRLSPDAVPSQGPSRDIGTDICNAVSSVGSFFIGKMTNGVLRPMGNCWGQWDGGGYYVFGREGPGSLQPVYTQTFYRPIEWAPCSTRSYGFDITIGGPTTASDIISQYSILDPTWWAAGQFGVAQNVEHYFAPEYLIAAADSLQALTGGYAVTLAFSTNTGNWSVYLSTVNNNISYSQAYSNLLTHIVVTSLLADAGQGHVWAFYGSNIHDTWNLRRDPTGVCSTPLAFIYLFGTRNVNYN